MTYPTIELRPPKAFAVSGSFVVKVIAAIAITASALTSASAKQQKANVLKPGTLVALNAQKDVCKNKGKVVKCPDVIVAKPDKSSKKRKSSSKFITGSIRSGKVVSRKRVSSISSTIPVSKGTYNCYNEDPPGHFNPVTCPDTIILDTNS